MVALRAFESNYGRLPEQLDALVPDYLEVVPLDYFDGKAIRYSPEQHLIYSVGSDFADANGHWLPGEPCNSELGYPIPFSTANHRAAAPSRATCGAPRS